MPKRAVPARPRAGAAAAPRGCEPLADEVERLRALAEHLRAENEQLLGSQLALEISRDDLTDHFEAAPLASLISDERGMIHSVNQAARELLGAVRRVVMGRRLSQLIVPADRPIFAAHLGRCVRRTDPARPLDGSMSIPAVEVCEVHLITNQVPGQLVQLWSRCSWRPRPVVQTTLMDLQAREQDTQERAELLRAIEDAQKANDAKDKFIAMLSHELRTPLTPVLAVASAFHGDPEIPTRLREVFKMIVRNVETEARLIDDLLDVTRIAQGKMHAQPVPADLHAIVREVHDIFDTELRDRRQNLSLELNAERAVARVDPVRMQQLFGNLVKNAIKFSPVGSAIRIRSWGGPSAITIEVEDNGAGMDPSELARIFEPFNQLDVDPARSSGLGLGLAICKGIVDLHGGQLNATSRGRGLGARFLVQLPLTNEPAVAAGAGGAARMFGAGPAPAALDAGPACRILLIEDHADTAEMVTELLIGHGYEVRHAGTVEDALAVDLAWVDLIVSDLGLPDGNGFDLIRRLQSVRHCPAIALSGYGMGSDVQAARQAGFDIHLTKPVDFDKLMTTIRALEPRRAASRRVAHPARKSGA